MMNISLSKAILTAGFIGAILFAYEAFTRNTAENLNSNKKLIDSGLSEQWKSGNVILLIRHEERCDRSSNPCLGSNDGITRLGGEKSQAAGARIKSYFGLERSDIFTTPTTRTIQTSNLMFGIANLLPDRESACGNDITDKLLKYKNSNRNLILITHNTCINDLIEASGHKKSGNPEYGSLLFSKTSSNNEIQIIGRLNADDLPKHPSQL
ncbi:histidine phosphatase family protein [Pseudomonas lactis]|nr:histidine phosphatase family protein [Pseudomonas lactis]